jgi:hypothetical protein
VVDPLAGVPARHEPGPVMLAVAVDTKIIFSCSFLCMMYDIIHFFIENVMIFLR